MGLKIVGVYNRDLCKLAPVLIPSSIFKEAMNSENDFGTFLSDECERPRLSILKNFKSINRVMRSSYLKNPFDLPDEEVPAYHKVKELSAKMTYIMKHMGSASKLQPPALSQLGEQAIGNHIRSNTSLG
jgi:hypothetical protein